MYSPCFFPPSFGLLFWNHIFYSSLWFHVLLLRVCLYLASTWTSLLRWFQKLAGHLLATFGGLSSSAFQSMWPYHPVLPALFSLLSQSRALWVLLCVCFSDHLFLLFISPFLSSECPSEPGLLAHFFTYFPGQHITSLASVNLRVVDWKIHLSSSDLGLFPSHVWNC